MFIYVGGDEVDKILIQTDKGMKHTQYPEYTKHIEHVEPILMSVPHNCPEYCEAYRLLKFIQYFSPIKDVEIPPTSLLREFLGGSSFKY